MFKSCKEGRRPKGEAKVRDVSCNCGLMERFRDPIPASKQPPTCCPAQLCPRHTASTGQTRPRPHSTKGSWVSSSRIDTQYRTGVYSLHYHGPTPRWCHSLVVLAVAAPLARPAAVVPAAHLVSLAVPGAIITVIILSSVEVTTKFREFFKYRQSKGLVGLLRISSPYQ